MDRRKRWVIGGVVALGLLGAAGGIAAGGADDHETPITGADLERASKAALAKTGGGRVTETEAGDEEGAYEVEVSLDDGRQVDVHLDGNFKVLSRVADEEDSKGDPAD